MGTYTDRNFTTLVLDDTLLEFSEEGRGDYRTPFVAASCGSSGERTLDLRFTGYRTGRGILPIKGRPLPQAKDPYGEAETLELDFRDSLRMVELTLAYTVFPSSDTIIRRSTIRNASDVRIVIRALASSQLDIRETGMKVLTLENINLYKVRTFE